MRGKRVKDMTQQQFYDKMVSRMDKMCGSLDKIARMLEAMQKANEDSKNRCIISLTNAETVHKYAESEKE